MGWWFLEEGSASAIPDLLRPMTNLGQQKDEQQPSSNEEKTPSIHSVPIIPPSTSPVHFVHPPPTNTQQEPMAIQSQEASHSGPLTTTTENNELIPVPRGQNYVDITEYLNMPQAEAAKKLGIPPSTLSKRWKEAVRKRKWPYRMICKIDKEIMTLLHNVPQGPNAPPLPEEIETALGISLRKRQEELRPVVIRI